MSRKNSHRTATNSNGTGLGGGSSSSSHPHDPPPLFNTRPSLPHTLSNNNGAYVPSSAGAIPPLTSGSPAQSQTSQLPFSGTGSMSNRFDMLPQFTPAAAAAAAMHAAAAAAGGMPRPQQIAPPHAQQQFLGSMEQDQLQQLQLQHLIAQQMGAAGGGAGGMKGLLPPNVNPGGQVPGGGMDFGLPFRPPSMSLPMPDNGLNVNSQMKMDPSSGMQSSRDSSELATIHALVSTMAIQLADTHQQISDMQSRLFMTQSAVQQLRMDVGQIQTYLMQQKDTPSHPQTAQGPFANSNSSLGPPPASSAQYSSLSSSDVNEEAPKKRGRPRLSDAHCALCGTSNTPQWRKFNGQRMCNACGLLYRERARQQDLVKAQKNAGAGAAAAGIPLGHGPTTHGPPPRGPPGSSSSASIKHGHHPPPVRAPKPPIVGDRESSSSSESSLPSPAMASGAAAGKLSKPGPPPIRPPPSSSAAGRGVGAPSGLASASASPSSRPPSAVEPRTGTISADSSSSSSAQKILDKGYAADASQQSGSSASAGGGSAPSLSPPSLSPALRSQHGGDAAAAASSSTGAAGAELPHHSVIHHILAPSQKAGDVGSLPAPVRSPSAVDSLNLSASTGSVPGSLSWSSRGTLTPAAAGSVLNLSNSPSAIGHGGSAHGLPSLASAVGIAAQVSSVSPIKGPFSESAGVFEPGSIPAASSDSASLSESLLDAKMLDPSTPGAPSDEYKPPPLGVSGRPQAVAGNGNGHDVLEPPAVVGMGAHKRRHSEVEQDEA